MNNVRSYSAKAADCVQRSQYSFSMLLPFHLVTQLTLIGIGVNTWLDWNPHHFRGCSGGPRTLRTAGCSMTGTGSFGAGFEGGVHCILNCGNHLHNDIATQQVGNTAGTKSDQQISTSFLVQQSLCWSLWLTMDATTLWQENLIRRSPWQQAVH